jgi:hypothetical protein
MTVEHQAMLMQSAASSVCTHGGLLKPHSHFHLLLHTTQVTNVVMGSSAERVCSCCDTQTQEQVSAQSKVKRSAPATQ